MRGLGLHGVGFPIMGCRANLVYIVRSWQTRGKPGIRLTVRDTFGSNRCRTVRPPARRIPDKRY